MVCFAAGVGSASRQSKINLLDRVEPSAGEFWNVEKNGVRSMFGVPWTRRKLNLEQASRLHGDGERPRPLQDCYLQLDRTSLHFAAASWLRSSAPISVVSSMVFKSGADPCSTRWLPSPLTSDPLPGKTSRPPGLRRGVLVSSLPHQSLRLHEGREPCGCINGIGLSFAQWIRRKKLNLEKRGCLHSGGERPPLLRYVR
jgi:hypothetical protein